MQLIEAAAVFANCTLGRLLSTAGQNAGRLRAGAELFASNAYTMLLKPWMDRWSERWSEGSKDGRK